MDPEVIGGMATPVIVYIVLGGAAWSIMNCFDFEDDAAILCAIGWPLTLLVWACIGFVLVVLFIPKAVFRYSTKLIKSAAKLNRRRKHVAREVK